jgi:hypothetical protein
VILLALATLAVGASPALAASPVVMLVFDEFPTDALRLPDGRIDSVRFPNFARLARTATWYPNAHTVFDHTPSAVPAILDALLPREGLRADAEDHPDNVFTLFGEGGWKVVASEEASDVCGERYCPGAAESRKDIFTNLKHGRERRLQTWLRQIRPGPPTFYFKHVLLPHLPWWFLPSGRQVDPARGHLASTAGFHDPDLTRHNEQRFLLQLGYVDRQVGRLVARLRRAGLFDRTLIVMLADHGMSFDLNTEDRRQVTERNVDEIAPVPLFIKAPGQRRGRIDRAYVRTIDVLPTMAEILGLGIPWEPDGRPASDPATRARREVSIPTRLFERRVRIGARAWERRRRAIRRQRARTFGTGSRSRRLTGSPWGLVYRAVPYRLLLGRRVTSLEVGPPRGLEAELLEAERWRSVRPRAHVLPLQVAGWISPGVPFAKRVIAASVNGRIEALGRSFHLRSWDLRETFSLLLPESALRRGRNRVRLFAVSGRGESPRLTPLPQGTL